jgi:hypothetical protein
MLVDNVSVNDGKIIYIYTYIYIHIQRDATMRSIYLFHRKITPHVSGAFYTHHPEYRKLQS